MKLNKYVLFGLALIVPVVANAESEMKPYISFKGGWLKLSNVLEKTDIKYKNGFNFRGTVGINVDHFDYELEGIYTYNNHEPNNINNTKIKNNVNDNLIKEGDTTSYSAFINSYFNVMPDEVVNPYIGIGIGLTKPYISKYVDYFEKGVLSGYVNVKNIKPKIAPSYQLIAGMKFRIENSFDISLDYRHFSTFNKLKDNFSNNKFKNFKHDSINLGLWFNF